MSLLAAQINDHVAEVVTAAAHPSAWPAARARLRQALLLPPLPAAPHATLQLHRILLISLTPAEHLLQVLAERKVFSCNATVPAASHLNRA